MFLLAVAFVFAFVPAMLDPFTAAGGSALIVADGTASHLAEDALAETPRRPNVLDESATKAFFDADECELDGDPIDEALADGDRIDVTLVPLDEGDEESCGSGGPADDVAVAQRLVTLDGDQYRLTVRVW